MRLEQQEERLCRLGTGADLVGQHREAERDALGFEAIALAVERRVQALFLEDQRRESWAGGW